MKRASNRRPNPVNKRRALAALGIAGLIGTLTAQTPADKALSEQDFLKKMDAIGTAKKPRLGLEGTGLDEKKKAPPPKKTKGETVITSTDETTFDQKTREAVFI